MDKDELPPGDEFIKYEVDITPDPPEWRLAAAKAELADTDYHALKYVDGELSESEYAAIRAKRARLRERVRELEAEQAAYMDGGD